MSDSHLTPMTCEGLGSLDAGFFGKQVNLMFRRLFEDICSRPCDQNGKTQKRTLKIDLELVPKVEMDNLSHQMRLVEIVVVANADIKMPKSRGGPNVVRQRDGQFVFNREFPDEFEAQGLPFGDDDDAEV